MTIMDTNRPTKIYHNSWAENATEKGMIFEDRFLDSHSGIFFMLSINLVLEIKTAMLTSIFQITCTRNK